MKITALLQDLRKQNQISEEQFLILSAGISGQKISLYRELRVLLYLGVLLLVAGMGITIRQYFSDFGAVAIISSLVFGFLACFTYCFLKSPKFQKEATVQPHMALDYLLVLGCLLYSLEVSYLETQYHLLDASWRHHLVISAGLFFFLAYRFDNRMVLSLALSTLAAWLGFSVAHFDFLLISESYRTAALTYGLFILAVGIGFHFASIKKHFFQIYLNFAAQFIFISLLTGIEEFHLSSFHALGLMITVVAAVMYASRSGKFVYMFYGVIYGYIGLSIVLAKYLHREGALYAYLILSSIAVVVVIYKLSRKFKGAN